MKILPLVKQIVDLSPRFADGEVRTAKFIDAFLSDSSISFEDQNYDVSVPFPKKAELKVDGEVIDCRNVGMKSGVFNTKNHVLSSLIWENNSFFNPQNINFNPLCENSVSMAMYYHNPAIAVRRNDVPKILNATQITGETIVEPYHFTGHNYLVGNTTDPQHVVFTHYDSWESGAIDNASGTAILMALAASGLEGLTNTLLVIAGTEEISYEEPITWGYGYRAFQKEYLHRLEKAQSIKVIDCVGYSKHEWVTDPEHVVLGLPLRDFGIFSNKCSMLCGDFDTLMSVYHSNDDTPELLSEGSLQEAYNMLVKSLS